MTHRIKPGTPVRLDDIPTRGEQFHDDRASAEAECAELRQELIDLQKKLYAENRHKLLIVLQARDGGGKDSTTRRVFRGVNPQGLHVTSFKKPSHREAARDFLWRVHRAVPAAGMIGVFNRSHYEDVVIVRVLNLVPESVWRPRYEHINQFERLLVETGTRVLKFYLHISKDEQKERLQKRLDNPKKHWKFVPEDVEKRKHWDDFTTAYEEAITRCSTPWAPWHVIPADQKWYRDLAVTRVAVEALRDLDPQYPPLDDHLKDLAVD